MEGGDAPQIPTLRRTTNITAQLSVVHTRRKVAATDSASEYRVLHAPQSEANRPPIASPALVPMSSRRLARPYVQTSEKNPYLHASPKTDDIM